MGKFPFTKGDRVRDAEGHEGDVVDLYLMQGKVRVRWHRGYASTEYTGELVAATETDSPDNQR